MADPTKPYEGFGDPASRHVHIRARIGYMIAQLEEGTQPPLWTTIGARHAGFILGLKKAIEVMDGG